MQSHLTMVFSDLLASDWLKSIGSSLCSFINPGTLGGVGKLSWDELKLMHQAGHQIESHSFSHFDFTNFDDRTLNHEIENSSFEIERQLNYRTSVFAYPFGRRNRRVKSCLEANNIQIAFSATDGIIGGRSPKLAIPRFVLNAESSAEQFLHRIKSAKEFTHRNESVRDYVKEFIPRTY